MLECTELTELSVKRLLEDAPKYYIYLASIKQTSGFTYRLSGPWITGIIQHINTIFFVYVNIL